MEESHEQDVATDPVAETPPEEPVAAALEEDASGVVETEEATSLEESPVPDEVAAADEPPTLPDSDAATADTALPQVALGPKSRKIPWWPFLTYLVAWIGVVAASILTLSSQVTALPAIQQEPYPYLILAGLVLALLGPILSMIVWFIVWFRAEKDEREGLLTASLVKGAGVTLLGVLMWWGTLVAVDALRLGMVG